MIRRAPYGSADFFQAKDAAGAQTFLGVTTHGIAGIVRATGNPDCAMLLSMDESDKVTIID